MSSNDDERDALTRELQHRSRDIEGHPIAFASVKRSARKMRNRRRLVGGAAAAAVLAIAVPSAFALGRTTSPGQGAVAQPGPTAHTRAHHATTAVKPTQEATPDSTATPSRPQVHTVALAASGATQGSAPAIAYLDDSTLVRPDGGKVTLPSAYSSVTPYRGGYLATLPDNSGGYTVYQLDGSLHVLSQDPGAQQLALSADGVEAAYFVNGGPGKPGQLRSGLGSGMSDLENIQKVPAGTLVTPVGFVGAGQVAYQTDGAAPKAYVTGFRAGHQPTELTGLLTLGGADEVHGLVSAQTKTNPDGSACSAVVKVSTMQHLFDTCDYTLGRFSVDGKYLIGGPSYRSGLGDTSLTILTSAGHPVVSFKADGDLFIRQAVWDGDRHDVLALVHQNGDWRVLRLGLDGSVTAATAPVAGTDTAPAFAFSATP
jgi:hypothetical protein